MKILKSACMIILVLCAQTLLSQPLPCPLPSPLPRPTHDCEDAPFVCMEGFCNTLDFVGTQQFGDLVCENPNPLWYDFYEYYPYYYKFIPTCPQVEIQILVGDDCGVLNAGLQGAIISSCPWNTTTIEACSPGVPENGTMVLTATLNVGQVYWLMLDVTGWQCDFQFTSVNCIQSVDLTEEIESVEANVTDVCPGFTGVVFEAAPPVSEASGYWWIFDWNPNDTMITSDPMITIDIPSDLAEGNYNVCVKAFTGCDVTDNDVCTSINVLIPAPIYKTPDTFCNQSFPFTWHALTISGEGLYSQSFSQSDGCLQDSLWEVYVYLESTGILDTIHCLADGETVFTYQGQDYSESGIYTLYYPGQSIHGCDSTTEMHLTILGMQASIHFFCENGFFFLEPQVQNVIPDNASIEWTWNLDGQYYSNDTIIEPVMDGEYALIASVSNLENESCTFALDYFDYIAATYLPDTSELSWGDTAICAQAEVEISVVPEAEVSYTWSGPPGSVISQNNSSVATFDFSEASSGQVCVTPHNDCGTGLTSCIWVSISNVPIAGFILDSFACLEDTIELNYTGIINEQTMISWQLDSSAMVMDSTSGSLRVYWNSPGMKIIAQYVSDSICGSGLYTDSILIWGTEVPAITCLPTPSLISFDWQDIQGSDCYLVSINGAQPFQTCNSNWDVSGLTPGDTISINVETIYGNTCVPTSSSHICIASECTINAIGSTTDILCFGDTTGAIMVTTSGGAEPLHFDWSNGSSAQAIDHLGAGEYSLTVTDANGCYQVLNFTLIENSLLEISLDSITLSNDANVANIYVTITGGQEPYSPVWATPDSMELLTEDLLGLTISGIYSLTITDFAGCVEEHDVIIDKFITSTNIPKRFHSVNVYPSPAKSVVFLDFEEAVEKIIITSADGRQVQWIHHPPSNQVDISVLPPGYYIIYAYAGQYGYVSRFIK